MWNIILNTCLIGNKLTGRSSGAILRTIALFLYIQIVPDGTKEKTGPLLWSSGHYCIINVTNRPSLMGLRKKQVAPPELY
jgi:hypothetical protein